jgi:uncharacterized protein YfaS (alpha-2-macroglobulin family)
VQSATPVTLKVEPPAGAVGDTGGLEVLLDASGLGGVDEGLRYLIDYPYGCLEQTTSRVIPMVKVEDLARSLDLPGLRGPELKGCVEAGLTKILRHQHDSGAFSLWPGARPEPFLTAFALFGLNQARRAGYPVDKKVIERGLKALGEGLSEKDMGHSDNPLGEAGSRAFALYVLAELDRPDTGAMARLFAERASLPVFGEALLARALKKGGGDAAAIDTLVADVVGHAQKTGDGAQRITDPKQQDLWWYFSSDVRTSALALSMLLEVAPDHALVPELARGLLAARTGGRWDNTQDNLFSLVALADYARRRQHAAATVKVALDGKALFSGKLGAGRPLHRVRIPMAGLRPGALTLTADGGAVAYSARIRSARSLEAAAEAQSGFSLTRTLEDPQTNQVRTLLSTGETVRVVLRVHATEARAHVALVDHLPAGLEAVNPRLERSGDEGEDGHDWQDEERFAAMELHDDRVAVFAERMGAGNDLEFSYLARATTAGTFLAPAATVEEMYRPDHRARTAATHLEVRAR